MIKYPLSLLAKYQISKLAKSVGLYSALTLGLLLLLPEVAFAQDAGQSSNSWGQLMINTISDWIFKLTGTSVDLNSTSDYIFPLIIAVVLIVLFGVVMIFLRMLPWIIISLILLAVFYFFVVK